MRARESESERACVCITFWPNTAGSNICNRLNSAMAIVMEAFKSVTHVSRVGINSSKTFAFPGGISLFSSTTSIHPGDRNIQKER